MLTYEKRIGLLLTLTILAAVSFTNPLFAQFSQPARYEKEIKFSEPVFTIIPLYKEGLALIRDKEKFESGKRLWEIVILDGDLKERKSVELPVEPRNKLIGYEYNTGLLMLLYRQGDNDKSPLEIITIYFDSDERPRYIVKPDLALRITHFSKIGSSIVLGGYVGKEPSVFLFDVATETLKVLPGFFQKDTELVDLRVNQNKTFNVVLIDRAVRDERRVVFQAYDESGFKLLEDAVVIDEKLTLHTGLTSTLEREDLMIVGSWGVGNSKQSNGFYALRIDPFRDQKIQYVAFGELKHYFDNQKERRAKRIQEKTIEEIKRGGIPNYTSYVMPYRIMEYENGFLMLAEVYIPSQSFNNFSGPYSPYYYNPYYSPYGWYYPSYRRLYSRPYMFGQNPRDTEAIKVSQSILLSFDPSGKVQWDVSMGLDEAKQPSLDQVSDFHYVNNKAVLFYKKKSELKAKWFVVGSKEAEEITEKIKLNDPSDEIRSERENEGGVMNWYENTFYLWGYHTIRNTTAKDRTRDVFYINKIEVE